MSEPEKQKRLGVVGIVVEDLYGGGRGERRAA